MFLWKYLKKNHSHSTFIHNSYVRQCYYWKKGPHDVFCTFIKEQIVAKDSVSVTIALINTYQNRIIICALKHLLNNPICYWIRSQMPPSPHVLRGQLTPPSQAPSHLWPLPTGCCSPVPAQGSKILYSSVFCFVFSWNGLWSFSCVVSWIKSKIL